jgi:hypothetical protein
VKAGAPAKSLYGFDIVNFWDLGFEMFQDHGRFDDAHFVQADIMAVDDDEIEGEGEGEGKGELAEFKGKIDVISIAQVSGPEQQQHHTPSSSPHTHTHPLAES